MQVFLDYRVGRTGVGVALFGGDAFGIPSFGNGRDVFQDILGPWD